MIRMTSCVLTLTLALATCVPPQPGPNGITDPNALVKLRTEKNIAEDYVLRAKQFSDVSKQEHARILYADAIDRYNAYADGLLACIRSGQRADLTPSANEASAAAATFKKFINDNSMTKGAVDPVSIVTKLLEVATSLVDKASQKDAAWRKQYADDLAPQIKWRKWIDIKD